mmetsp:Transcript_61788/g.145666  ORF Transcript_61788/g.145666 Transcript_61788/m.145666 type:complete len:209 (-) Transcript_61788:257-883(-)
MVAKKLRYDLGVLRKDLLWYLGFVVLVEPHVDVDLAAGLDQRNAVELWRRARKDVAQVRLDWYALVEQLVHVEVRCFELGKDIRDRALEIAMLCHKSRSNRRAHAIASEQQVIRQILIHSRLGVGDEHPLLVSVNEVDPGVVPHAELACLFELVIQKPRDGAYNIVAIHHEIIRVLIFGYDLGAPDVDYRPINLDTHLRDIVLIQTRH